MRKFFISCWLILSLIEGKAQCKYTPYEIQLWVTKGSEGFVDHVHMVDGIPHIAFGYNIKANGMKRVKKYQDKDGKISFENGKSLLLEFYAEEVDWVFDDYTATLNPYQKCALRLYAYNCGTAKIKKGGSIFKQIHSKKSSASGLKSCCKGSCCHGSHDIRRKLEDYLFRGEYKKAEKIIEVYREICIRQIVANKTKSQKPSTKKVNCKPKK